MDSLDNFTLGDLKKIAEKFKVFEVKGNGRAVIVRAREAGVHYGHLVSYEGRTVILENARRLWKWTALEGIALSGVAVHGLKPRESKLDSLVTKIVILDACEIIDCSEKAIGIIEAIT